MFAKILMRSALKGAAWFAAIAVVSAYYFGQVEVGGFTIGLGHEVVQSDRGIDPTVTERNLGGWR